MTHVVQTKTTFDSGMWGGGISIYLYVVTKTYPGIKGIWPNITQSLQLCNCTQGK